MAKILFIDTASKACLTGLADEGFIADLSVSNGENNHSEVLNNQINALLLKNSLTFNDIDAIAADAGPGSYTGLRIGLGTAKAFAYAKDIPIILFNRFEIIAASYPGRHLTILLKARSHEWFWAQYDAQGHEQRAPAHITEESLANKDFSQTTVITDTENIAFATHTELLASPFIPDIDLWNHSAQQRFLEKKFADTAYCHPLYLKAPFTTQARKNILS